MSFSSNVTASGLKWYFSYYLSLPGVGSSGNAAVVGDSSAGASTKPVVLELQEESQWIYLENHVATPATALYCEYFPLVNPKRKRKWHYR